MPCNHVSRCRASSAAPGREPIYCTDRSTIPWWQAGADDATPTLEFDIRGRVAVSALRLWWPDEGLDYDAGVLPGPFQYRLDGRMKDGDWFCLVDRSRSETDLLIDFQTFDEALLDTARLTITGWPRGIIPALIDCTLFGKHVMT